MGIIRLTLFSAIAVGGAMVWFGRDEGLPEDRIGRERVAIPQSITTTPVVATPTPIAVSAPVSAPDPTPASQQPTPTPQPAPDPAPDPEPVVEPTPDPPADPVEEVAALPVLYVTGTRVNMRAGPATSFGKVGALTRGTAVDDMGEAAPGWSQIRVIETGQRGFMATRFLSPSKP